MGQIKILILLVSQSLLYNTYINAGSCMKIITSDASQRFSWGKNHYIKITEYKYIGMETNDENQGKNFEARFQYSFNEYQMYIIKAQHLMRINKKTLKFNRHNQTFYQLGCFWHSSIDTDAQVKPHENERALLA